MTQTELQNLVAAQVAAALSAITGPTPNATPAPVASSTPAWVADAVAARTKAKVAKVATKAPTAPKPLVAGVETTYPACDVCDAHQPHGADVGHAYVPKLSRFGKAWAPFKVLHVHNGASGRAYSGDRLSERSLRAIVAWLGSPEGQAFQKTGSF